MSDMKRIVTLENVSYRTRKLCLNGEWIPVSARTDISQEWEVGKEYLVTFRKGAVNPWVIAIVEEPRIKEIGETLNAEKQT